MQIETRHSAIRRQIREAEQAERLADDRCDFQEHQRQIEKLWALYALERTIPVDTDDGAVYCLVEALDIVSEPPVPPVCLSAAKTLRRVVRAVKRGKVNYQHLADLRTLLQEAETIAIEWGKNQSRVVTVMLAEPIERALAWLARPKPVDARLAEAANGR